MGKGIIRFKSATHDPPHVTFDVHDMLLVPGVTTNLLSGNRLRKGGTYLHNDEKGWWLETRHKQLLVVESTHGNIDQVFLNVKLMLPDKPPPITNSFSYTHAVNTGTWQQWHYRLGHPSHQRMRLLFHGDLATGWKITEKEAPPTCPGCKEAQLQKTPFPSSVSTVTRSLEIEHADLAFYHQSYDGKCYMLVLVDQLSKFLWTFALTKKGLTTPTILEWLSYAERSLDSSLKVFRSGRGGEFTPRELQQQFKRLGIWFETSVPGNPEQNRIPEHMNRTIKEMLTAMLRHMDLQLQWWTLALPWVTWVRNILPTRAMLDTETPFTKATGKKPNLELLKVFGCMCQYLVPLQKQEKLEPKARWGVHAGFAEGMKGWQVLNVETETLHTT